MSYVIRVLELAGKSRSLNPRPPSGAFVVDYDADAHAGGGHLSTSSVLEEAKQFDSFTDAWEFWRQPSKVQPLRADGKPNRPLTAFSVEISPYEKASRV